MIDRRVFLPLMGAAACAIPIAARGQPSQLPLIGFLGSSTAEAYASRVAAFGQGLAETGFVDGKSCTIEYRWAEDQTDRLPAMAADLVRRGVTVIAAASTPSVIAAKAATTTIPIVFSVGLDPVRFGFVASLNRPGGNITGAVNQNAELVPKRLQLMHELVPGTALLAVLLNSGNANSELLVKDVQAAAQVLGRRIIVLSARTEREIDAAFASMAQQKAGGLVIGQGNYFVGRGAQFRALAIRYSMPIIHQDREFVVAGGLMCYGGRSTESYRIAGTYTGRILKGETPADLPVQQLARTELAINLKTAKAMGITFPQSILLRADEVIE
jgi:putative tryptophan/tyrosine transport system substrate-binding protein